MKNVVGFSSCACEVPEGWNAIAEANWRSLQEDMATRKFLCSGSPARTEGLCSVEIGAIVAAR
jgi:hypothetical protein